VSEAGTQRAIVAAAEACGAVVIRMNAGRGRYNQKLAPPGTPDLLIIGKHRTVWVEVKAPDGKLRQVQEEMIQLLRDRGHEVTVAREVTDLPVPL